MKIPAARIPPGTPATLPCGCRAVTGQSYAAPPLRPTGDRRPWVIDRACRAHRGRERQIVEIGAAEILDCAGDASGVASKLEEMESLSTHALVKLSQSRIERRSTPCDG